MTRVQMKAEIRIAARIASCADSPRKLPWLCRLWHSRRDWLRATVGPRPFAPETMIGPPPSATCPRHRGLRRMLLGIAARRDRKSPSDAMPPCGGPGIIDCGAQLSANYSPNSASADSTRCKIGVAPNCKNIRFASVKCLAAGWRLFLALWSKPRIISQRPLK
jgi:hypothetical protein